MPPPAWVHTSDWQQHLWSHARPAWFDGTIEDRGSKKIYFACVGGWVEDRWKKQMERTQPRPFLERCGHQRDFNAVQNSKQNFPCFISYTHQSSKRPL
jgi:hypothetical protein